MCVLSFIFYNFAEFLNVHTKVGNFEIYDIPLKELSEGTHEYEFLLDDKFFEELEGPEIGRGNVEAFVSVKKTAHAFEIDFDLQGSITIQCDRCLDDMNLDVDCEERFLVKFGDEYSEEEGNLIVVPEAEGAINLAWYLYECIALRIPIRHVHPAGECNEAMVAKLRNHIATSADDDELYDNDEDEEDLTPLDSEEKAIDPRWEGLRKLIDNN